jgi:hypothetical protein
MRHAQIPYMERVIFLVLGISTLGSTGNLGSSSYSLYIVIANLL